MSRCLYNSSFRTFLNTDDNSIFGLLCERYHGEALTTTREAWKSEIAIMKVVLNNFADKRGISYLNMIFLVLARGLTLYYFLRELFSVLSLRLEKQEY